MDQVTIRPATLADLDVLLAFEQAIIDAERPFDATLRPGPNVHYYDLESLISSPDVELVLAQLDSQTIGSEYARIEASKSYLSHSDHSYVGFVYVVPKHRGKGISQKILETLEAWSRSRGVTEMRLEVYATNAPAIRAYEKAGYAALTVAMRKELKS